MHHRYKPHHTPRTDLQREAYENRSLKLANLEDGQNNLPVLKRKRQYDDDTDDDDNDDCKYNAPDLKKSKFDLDEHEFRTEYDKK